MTVTDLWLASALRYLEEWLVFQMRHSLQPGCAIAIRLRGELVFERAFGVASLSTGAALTPHHRFRVASHSKTFTAVAIMLLREQGRIRLDDTVGTYVSGMSDQLAGTTISQLLSHSSGLLRDGSDCGHWDDLRPFYDEAALRLELSRSLVLGPSERLKYSNIGFGLLGLVIAGVTGEAYDTWIAREVVAKVGLEETLPDLPAAPDLPEARVWPLASGHTGRLPVGRTSIPGSNSTRALAPATGFVSTAGDLALFFGQLDPGAPSSILSAASRREMTRRQWKGMHSKTDVFYGLGTISGTASERDYFGHTGGFYGYSSCTWVVPNLGITASIILNSVDGPASAWMEGVLHILDRFAKAGAPQDAVRAWHGRWWNPWGTVDLVPMGDRVLIASPETGAPFEDASEITVTSDEHGAITAATAFGSYGEPVVRSLDGEGRPTSLRIAGEEHLPEEDFVQLRRRAIAAMDDILTPRLVLRLMDQAATAACLAGDVTAAAASIGAEVPEELLEDLTGLRFDQLRQDEDPQYRAWATRAIILGEARLMVGHVRFHSRPWTEGGQDQAPASVEIGIRVFSPHRRNLIAKEAVTALMDWAANNFGVGRFVMSVSPDNLPSLRLIRSLGFVRTGEALDELDGLEHVFERPGLSFVSGDRTRRM